MKIDTQFAVWLIWKIVPHVYCGKQLALNKPAWMSSVYGQSTSFSAAENSVDGDLRTHWDDGVCSATEHGDRSPWIVVDLLGQYEVHNVTIYNRGGSTSVRLHDFVIEVYRTNPSRCSTAAPAVCKTYAGVFGSIENVVCDNAVSGRFVRIWKPTTLTTDDILTVCEVEVYGIKPASRCPSVRYQRVNGKRLNAPGVTSFTEQLRTSCVSLCLMSETCVGVNYNGRTKACELISRPQPTDTVSLIQDSVFYGDDLC
ncbi:fucolectin-6-like [Haliotis rufescens]|uniref:fucolectin-6-like n=1 Tax=Haliotis rufescens TaxID=6454 RepID=UPI00201E8679|nr:fucolectin-6-like [Haliotis rufescens]